MRLFLMRFLLCLLILITGAHTGSAQQVQPLDPEWLQRMSTEGWEKVQEGVLQRGSEAGGLQTFTYGAEGIQWLLQSHERRLRFFEERYSESPDEKLAALIQDVIDEISRLNSDLASAPAAESMDLETQEGGCPEAAYSLSAWAGPQRSPRGVAATASARFNSAECNNRQGRTHVAIYVQAAGENGGSSTRTNSKDSADFNGAEILSSVAASMEGVADCKATAVAQVVLSDNDFTYTEEAPDHYGCPADITASISGPTVVTTDHYTSACADVTWSVSATGGTSPHTFEWYVNSISEGSGPILTKNYCAMNALLSVRVVARDANGWTDEETFQTELRHIPPVAATANGPSDVVTDSVTPCVNVTWTANASGGHSGYTYEWYTDTGTTDEGNGGSTFIKPYCRANGTVTVRVVASDSDGHTAEAAKETLFTHIEPPLTATVSGPSSVDSTSCVDVTWTASAQGGHPGYTYQWYIGIGSPVVGTGSSYTQRFCNTTETLTVRVVVRDSDMHSIEATKQTQIIGLPVAAISGPGTVTYDYYTSNCADVTWTASVTVGSPAFTYKWYVGSGTTVQGTGATFTKRYCDTNGSVTVKVVVTDSRSLSDDATFTTTLRYRDQIVASISAPSSVSTNTTPACMDVTWTASATSRGGNHSGFTYSWYIGTTLQGSGSTLTKRYCSAQSVTMRLVAKASDNHTDEDTRTSTVGPTSSSPVPTIGGPTYVELYYLPQCQDVTWTVSTTGGTSPYTYSWYVGTTLVGSGTSYTKSYCRTNQTVNLKVVARDAASRTGEDTHATTISYDPTTCMVQEDPDSSNTNIPVDPCN